MGGTAPTTARVAPTTQTITFEPEVVVGRVPVRQPQRPGNQAVAAEMFDDPLAGEDYLTPGELGLVATAGTDTHSSKDYAERPGFNVIYAETLSEAALLQAIKLGHLYLSSGPRLVLSAHNEAGQTWMMGDQVDQSVTLVAEWSESPADGLLRVLANGRLQSSQGTGRRAR